MKTLYHLRRLLRLAGFDLPIRLDTTLNLPNLLNSKLSNKVYDSNLKLTSIEKQSPLAVPPVNKGVFQILRHCFVKAKVTGVDWLL